MKVLKIGGSFITKKNGWCEINQANLKLSAKTIAAIWKKSTRDLVLVHGAGSFGHPLVVKYGLSGGITSAKQKLGYAATHAACSDLSLCFVQAIIDAGAPAISIPPAAIITQKNGRISSFGVKVVQDYLVSGYLPVLHGDMVPDSVLGGSVCSGDQVVAYLGRQADVVVLATDVDGVLDGEGNVIPEISNRTFPMISKYLKQKEGDVTGAMAGKIKELLDIGTVSYVVNAVHPERIAALIAGKPTVCTKIMR